jgi:hypothetical protein
LAKTKTIENLFIYIAIYSDILPILFFLIFFKKVRGNKTTWVLTLFVFFDLIFNILLGYFVPIKYHNKAYPIFTFFEMLFFSYFFYLEIRKPASKKTILIVSTIFAVALLIYYYYAYYFRKIVPHIDSVPIAIETLLIYLFSFFYFFQELNDNTTFFIYNKSSFWYVLGILIYLSGSFFIYIFANQLSIKELERYWIITNISSFSKNLFFIVPVFILARETFRKQPVIKGMPSINI